MDHIITRSFFREFSPRIPKSLRDDDVNCQPMHQSCNEAREGQIWGFPVFKCTCHFLEIQRVDGTFVLTMHDMSSGKHIMIHDGRDNRLVGSRAIYKDGKVVGVVDRVATMGRQKGRSLIAGEGHLGHSLPILRPDEVQLFNVLEACRVAGKRHPLGTIDHFNRRRDSAMPELVPGSFKVHFETTDEDNP